MLQDVPIADLVLALTDPVLSDRDGIRRATARATLAYEPPGSARLASPSFEFVAPLGPIEKEELDWYLERYHLWPTNVFRERAHKVERDLEVWGQRIYDAVLVDGARDAFDAWRAADASHRFTVLVDGVNAAAAQLLALPWELLHDGDEPVFHGRQDVLVRRRLQRREVKSPVPVTAPIRVLVISARPREDVDHRICALPLVDAFETLADLVELTVLEPPTVQAMSDELRRATAEQSPYHVVHFDGHGEYDDDAGTGGLLFEHDDDGERWQRRPLFFPAANLAKVLKRYQVPMVVLQACQSAATGGDVPASVAGRLSYDGVPTVIAMSHSVLVETARRFFTVFYRELVAGARIGNAMLEAQKALRDDDFRIHVLQHALHLRDWFVPVLYQDEDLALVRTMPAEALRRAFGKKRRLAFGSLPEEPGHRFVGRSRELLQAERRLTFQPYVVLRGEAGEGKTTLAAELVRWLVRTRRFARAAFVSLDHHPDGKAALFELGSQLVPGFVSQAAQDFDDAKKLLQEALAGERTVLVFDNMETVLSSEDAAEQIVDLAKELLGVDGTRIVFTSRERLPEPFGENDLDVSRLSRDDAVQLVANVLGRETTVPYVEAEGESEDDVVQLVDAVRCHARSLVLLAGEVASSGVRRATEDVRGVMEALHERYPDDRERSLFASVELSLRRLPEGMRERIRPLAVFHGGGHVTCMAMVLGLDTDKDEEVAMARSLVDVGLGEFLQYGYLRLHPALGPALDRELDDGVRHEARRAWADATARLALSLYEQQFKNARFSAVLTILELPNLLAALDHLRENGPAERAVQVAARIESLLEGLGRPNAMEQVVALLQDASRETGDWSHVRFEAEAVAVERLLETGRYAEAVDTARRLLARSLEVGDGAFAEAPHDIAYHHWLYGRALFMDGRAEEALSPLAEARRLFQKLAQGGDASATRMVSVCIAETGHCFRDVGRLDEAAETYETAIKLDEERGDRRGIASTTFQLGTVRLFQRRYKDAISAYTRARETAEALGEFENVAKAWHQIGMVYQGAGEYASAEEAHQRSLQLVIQHGNRAEQASPLAQSGNVYSLMGRWEEAVRFYQQAVTIFVETGNQLNEGRVRNNVANQLIKLRRFDEARREILRAIECYEPFGHVAQPWMAFDVLHELERVAGDESAAVQAWEEAVQAFLDYRRSGGENHATSPQIAADIYQAIISSQTGSAIAQVEKLQNHPDLPPGFPPFLVAIRDVLEGSRDLTLASNPEMSYECAAELTLLLEALASAEE